MVLKTGGGGGSAYSMGKVVAVCPHADCVSFTVCPLWEYLVTVSRLTDNVHQLKLWSIHQGGGGNAHEQEQLHHCTSPVFSLDGQYLYYIENGMTVMQYCLETTTSISCLQVCVSLCSAYYPVTTWAYEADGMGLGIF